MTVSCLDCGRKSFRHSRCPTCAAIKERGRRPSARQRGYDRGYESNRGEVLSKGRPCHVCTHPCPDQTDHLLPLSEGGTNDLANLAPIHGTVPCPVCGVRCNQVRGATR
jgi:5-methylcytosine-specific restriction endonuclease McrA